MSHLPNKELFFRNVSELLNVGGKLVVADWFKAEGLTASQVEADIKPIEGQLSLQTLIVYMLIVLGRWHVTPSIVHPTGLCRFCKTSQLEGLFRTSGHQQGRVQNLVRSSQACHDISALM
jgi:hypothetical protein